MPVSIDAQAGRKALISLQPAWNPTSSTDLANLNTFLTSCAANGLVADVILWPLPATAGLTATQYQAMIAYYGPTVRSFYPLVYHGLAGQGTGGSAATFASYYPGDAACDKVMVTYTAAAWEAGTTLDAYAAVADGAAVPKQFGIAELEANDSTDTAPNVTAFFSYVQTFMTTRIAAGKNNADVLWYDETPTTATTWSTISAGDYLVGLYQQLADALTGSTPPVSVGLSATLTVTATITPAVAGGSGSGLGGGGGGGPAPGVTGVPLLLVEAGFDAASPTPPDRTLLLGDPLNGILGTDTLAPGTVWTDLSAFVRSGSISRSSTRQSGPVISYNAGVASAVLRDGDARFDPSNLSGPYVAAGVTQVRPMVPLRVRALWGGTVYYLFCGYADAWQTPDTNWGPRYAETAVTASDGFKPLAGIQRPGVAAAVGGSEDTGARINRILDSAGWSPSDRLISSGDTTVQATDLSGDPLSEMQLVADTELGDLYVNGEGRVVFRHRQAVVEDGRSTVVQAVFGDLPGNPVVTFVAGDTPADLYAGAYSGTYGGGSVAASPGIYNDTYDALYPGGVATGFTELAYSAAGRADDDTQLVNDVQVTRVGGTLQEYTDLSSVVEFLFPRSYARTDLLLETDNEAQDWARYLVLVGRGSENRFDTLTIQPLRDPANLFPQVLGRDIGDRIQVWRRPPGMGGQAIVKDCFIRGIEHTFDASTHTWETVWTLQDASRFQFAVVGDTTLGVLGRYPLGY